MLARICFYLFDVVVSKLLYKRGMKKKRKTPLILSLNDVDLGNEFQHGN